MSYVEVFSINPEGNVISFGSARNNHGGAPMIWEHLIRKYGFSNQPYILSDMEALNRLWQCCGNNVYERWEDVLLAATFDHIYIPPHLTPNLMEEVADSFERFCNEVAKPQNKVETTGEIATLLRKILTQGNHDPQPICWGAAFNMCSAVSPFWNWEDEEGDSRPYNIFTDAEQTHGEYAGTTPVSLVEALKGASR